MTRYFHCKYTGACVRSLSMFHRLLEQTIVHLMAYALILVARRHRSEGWISALSMVDRTPSKMQRTSLARQHSLLTIMLMPTTERQARNGSSNDAVDDPITVGLLLHANEFDGHVEEEVGGQFIGIVEDTPHVFTEDHGAEERSQRATFGSRAVRQLEAADVGKPDQGGTKIDDFIHDKIRGLRVEKFVGEYPHLDQGVHVSVVETKALVRIRIEVAKVDTSHVILKDFRVVVVVENCRFERIWVPSRTSCCFEEPRPSGEHIGMNCEALLIL